MAWRILVICFWGIFHGLMLIINHLYRKATPNQNSSFLLCCLYWFVTMLGICIARVFFRQKCLMVQSA